MEAYNAITRRLLQRQYAHALIGFYTTLDQRSTNPVYLPTSTSTSDLAVSSSQTLSSSFTSEFTSTSNSDASWGVVPSSNNSNSVPSMITSWSSYSPALIQLLKLGITIHTSLYYSTTGPELLAELQRIPGAGYRSGGRQGTSQQDSDKEADAVRKVEEVAELLSPEQNNPVQLLQYLQRICGESLTPSNKGIHTHSNSPTPWPPSLIRTFILAALKIDASLPAPGPRNKNLSKTKTKSKSRLNINAKNPTPAGWATAEIRRIIEDWLGSVDDDVFSYWMKRSAKSSGKKTVTGTGESRVEETGKSNGNDLSASTSSVDSQPLHSSSSSSSSPPRRPGTTPEGTPLELDRFKKEYIAVIELYLLEILPAQGDWDLAAEFLREESIIGAKAKEKVFKRLHALKAKQEALSSSSSSSANRLVSASASAAAAAAGLGASENDTEGQETIRGSPSSRSRRSSLDTESTVKPTGRMNTGGEIRSGRQGAMPSRLMKNATRDEEHTIRGSGRGTGKDEDEDAEENEDDVSRPKSKGREEIASADDESERGHSATGKDKIPISSSSSPSKNSGTSTSGRIGGSFAQLRRRLNDFLDQPAPTLPLSSSSSTSPSPSSPSDALRPRRSTQQRPTTLSSRLTGFLKSRWSSLVTTLFVLYLLRAAGRRYQARKTRLSSHALEGSSSSAGSRSGTPGIALATWLKEAVVTSEFWSELISSIWKRIKNVLIMGMTITYV